MQVWKTQIHAGSGVTLLPKGAKPLSVHIQNGGPCLWSLVDPDAEKSEQAFHIAGTGHDLPENIGAFVGTFLVQNDTLVFHVFELNE